jgi:hypothetical protein
MLKIKLYDSEGEQKTFTKGFVSGRMLRKVMAFASKSEEEKTAQIDQMDELIHLVVEAFDNEAITFDSILDGTRSDELSDILGEFIQDIMGGKHKTAKHPANK